MLLLPILSAIVVVGLVNPTETTGFEDKTGTWTIGVGADRVVGPEARFIAATMLDETLSGLLGVRCLRERPGVLVPQVMVSVSKQRYVKGQTVRVLIRLNGGEVIGIDAEAWSDSSSTVLSASVPDLIRSMVDAEVISVRVGQEAGSASPQLRFKPRKTREALSPLLRECSL